ncbi:TPA: type I glyceraldehyde-3-phosphate dehydrogenase [Candidatus Woesearchaeota archaeon]|nr:type I glyceraldehyde-3-phosphate dehydrogenase [Candidatus Woesearchaeota archaeon]
MVNVAINGFGRIGRQVLRIGLKNPKLNFVAVNDLTNVETLAYLLKHDSVHGGYKGEVGHDKSNLIADGKKILVLSEKEPQKLPWKKLKVDIVVESTGFFRTKELASRHIEAGAKKVILSAPCKGEDRIKTIVLGVNEEMYNKKKDHIISNASCTTNCLAPVVKVLNDAYGIEHGLMTTVHSYTNDQVILDLPHKDLRRGRAAALNLIPTTTGAATAVTETIPELKGKLSGMAIRAPTPCGSITDFVCVLKKGTTAEKVNKLFKKAAALSRLKGILQYSEEPLVSSDIIGSSYSAVFDAGSTMMIGSRFLKVIAWYDNEWGYSSRIVDLLTRML